MSHLTPSAPVQLPSNLRHGSHTAYTHYHCRCQLCRTFATTYNSGMRRKRIEAFNEGRITITHGTLTSYNDYMCRCLECKQAKRDYSRLTSTKTAKEAARKARVARAKPTKTPKPRKAA